MDAVVSVSISRLGRVSKAIHSQLRPDGLFPRPASQRQSMQVTLEARHTAVAMLATMQTIQLIQDPIVHFLGYPFADGLRGKFLERRKRVKRAI